MDDMEMKSQMASGPSVQFAPFNSFVEPGFWWTLTEKKLNVYKLDDAPHELFAYYTNSDQPGLPCRLSLDFNALDSGYLAPANCVVSHGTLYLANTINAFKEYPKKQILHNIGLSVWSDIKSGRVFQDQSLLSRFVLLCFVDAKKYHYYYWFGFPAVCFPDEIRLSFSVKKTHKLSEIYKADEIAVLQRCCSAFARDDATGYFILEECDKALFQRHSLSKIKNPSCDASKLILAFCDPSTHDSAPGWPARNLLALWAFYRPEVNEVRLLCWRQRFSKGKVECEHSLMVHITYSQLQASLEGAASVDEESLKVVGWEKNEKGQLMHRFVDLSLMMDPTRLAESAVNLNLQLMRWRLVPGLDLDILSNTSCLIFGAGTLGCNVARGCLAWGMRKITFIDCANVSYSNPVRQSLFLFDDCLNGGKPKAEAAAAFLKRIYPNVDSKGVQLHLPMPGHFVVENELDTVKKTVEEVENLIRSHDIVFLLLDTREGRWLPTLLSTMHSKLTITVALGFESFVVVRHGFGCANTETLLEKGRNELISGDRLGCYFCNDVTAPGNSTIDRTLDQQCTVTRPGLSMVASALAVELAASALEHPLRGLAPAVLINRDGGDADQAMEKATASSCLGYVPHQIRGFASRFEQMTAAVERFSSCTACSNTVIDEYKKNGFEFLKTVFNDSSTLERLTGLDELKKNTDAAEILFLSDCEESD